MKQVKDFAGCYVVTNGPNDIKIGMSKNVEKRLQAYQGYQENAQPVNVLAKIMLPTSEYKLFEKHLHFSA